MQKHPIVLIGCIVQARMSSTRLPGKVLMNIKDNKKIIDFVISQLQHSKLLNKIVIATTTNKKDDPLVAYLQNKHIDIFRGNEKDILMRYLVIN